MIWEHYLIEEGIWEGGSALPYDAEIEYLENNAPGGAYIDTGFKPNQDTNIICYASLIRDGIASRFFEVRNGIWRAEYAVLNFGDSNNQLQSRFGDISGGQMMRTKLTPRDTPYKIEIRNKYLYLDDVYVADLGQNKTFQCNYNLLLFALNNAGTVSSQTDNYSRIHACQIYDNGTLVRDFIPVRVGQVGYMYDKVSGTLFGSAGTGSFTLGSDKIGGGKSLVISMLPTIQERRWVA